MERETLESKNLEFKREYTDKIKKTVVAFANTNGGRIFIGVDDDGSVCGVLNPDLTVQRVTNTIRDGIRPDLTMFTDCTVETREGQNVVVVTVQRGTVRPYYMAEKGVCSEGIYVRQGTSSVSASPAAILRMIRETGNDNYNSGSILGSLSGKTQSGEHKLVKCSLATCCHGHLSKPVRQLPGLRKPTCLILKKRRGTSPIFQLVSQLPNEMTSCFIWWPFVGESPAKMPRKRWDFRQA